ncbi:MAG: GH92 family glycosyl hydrolase [Bacteroidota bacterium]
MICWLAVLAPLIPLLSFAQEPVDYVDPFIGTTNYGATHPGAQYPHALASVSPFNVAFKQGEGNVHEKDLAWNSRVYIHENTYLTGYSHVNLSGVGCPELGTILTMPTAGELTFDPEQYGTTYHNQESRPGYFSHELEKHQVKVELSSTLRAGISRYTFREGGQSNIILNLGLALTNETGGMVRLVSDREVEGFRTIGTFCYHPEDVRPVYFVARLSKVPKSFGAWKKMPAYKAVEADWVGYNDTYKPYPGYQQELAGDDVGAYFSFDTEPNEVIEIKVGVSYVSIENARANLDTEIPDFDLDRVAKQSSIKWNELLGRVQVEGAERDKTLFYTALYHTLIHPNILQDVNGDYPKMGTHQVGNALGNRYTVFSLWDTNRNVHPLLSLIYPELQSEMVASMVEIYKEGGWLPKWELLGMETGVMVGDPAAPVIADTYRRGIRDFDVETAYQGMKKSADTRLDNPIRPENSEYWEHGYVPVDQEDKWGGSVSTSLEYYIADWNLAMLAKDLGYDEDHERYLEQSLGYKELFDPETGMLRPKRASGAWYSPFDPELGKNFEPAVGYVEGSAWNYRFYVPHDMKGLIQLNGGGKEFVDQLEQTFDLEHFDMANEPDITYPFLFNYVKGEEWRTQKRVKELITTHYNETAAGIPGNDDTGALSTWLLYAMMGFYPVCPGEMDYALSTPIFDQVTVTLNPDYYAGEKLVIVKEETGDGADFISQVKWNGAVNPGYFISHEELVKGGRLEFVVSEEPAK